MTTAMTTTNGNGQGGDMAFYDRVNPMEFITTMGKVFAHSGAGGCGTESEGQLLALTCLSERKPWTEVTRKFHLIDGKQSMKADVMLGEFRSRGGKHRWIKDGSDGREAVLELTDVEGNVVTTSYSIDDAKRAGIYRDGGGWTKNPANMLRARCSSNGVRMVAPEIVSGLYTPEELQDVAAESRAATPSRTASEVKSRREEILAASSGTTESVAISSPNSEVVIDVVESAEEPAPFTETETAPESAADWTALLEVTSLLTQVGMTKEQLEEQLRGQNPSFTTLESLPEEKLKTLAANIKAKIEASVKN